MPLVASFVSGFAYVCPKVPLTRWLVASHSDCRSQPIHFLDIYSTWFFQSRHGSFYFFPSASLFLIRLSGYTTLDHVGQRFCLYIHLYTKFQPSFVIVRLHLALLNLAHWVARLERFNLTLSLVFFSFFFLFFFFSRKTLMKSRRYM